MTLRHENHIVSYIISLIVKYEKSGFGCILVSGRAIVN